MLSVGVVCKSKQKDHKAAGLQLGAKSCVSCPQVLVLMLAGVDYDGGSFVLSMGSRALQQTVCQETDFTNRRVECSVMQVEAHLWTSFPSAVTNFASSQGHP